MEQLINYVIDNYNKADIPLEGFILEEYNINKDRIFTVALLDNYKFIPDIIKTMHDNN